MYRTASLSVQAQGRFSALGFLIRPQFDKISLIGYSESEGAYGRAFTKACLAWFYLTIAQWRIDMTRLDLQPFFRSTIGFDQIAEMLDNLTDDNRKQNHYPPYNIEKLNEESYRITVAVAGFREEDLDITKHNNLLTIEGKMSKKADSASPDHTFLYKGIAERSFQLQFRIVDHMLVNDVSLENGMLTINMRREIPEALKPQKITIRSTSGNPKVIEGKVK
jgi:molecular chaperone IbpA